MPKVKISEYSATANSNTDVASINIDEGCAPSGINNAIRAVMGHLKDFQQGTYGDPFNGPHNGTLGATTASTANVTTLTTSSTVTHNGGTANGVAYLNGSKVLTTGSALVFNGSSLGINTASPETVLHAVGGSTTGFTPALKVQFSNSTNAGCIQLGNDPTGAGTVCGLRIKGDTGGGSTYDTYRNSGGAPNHIFQVNATEYVRINSTGTWINASSYTTSYLGSGNTATGVFIESAGQLCVSRDNTVAGRFNRNSSDGTLISCARQGTEVGTIGVTTSATSYNTSSDYRLKNTIAPMTGALAKVAALKPVTYKWNVDGSDGEGFIAHELAEVCPNAVTGEKDGTQMQAYEITPAIAATYDADGIELTPLVEAVMGEREVPQYQGIDTSFLVATLTAAIQEQQTIITQLQADVAALKGA